MLIRTGSILAATMGLAGCATLTGQNPAPVATAAMVDQQGRAVGTATLVEQDAGYALRLSVSNIAPGAHGFHLHTVGRCDLPDFQSAGGHLNPGNHEHGSLNPRGKHLGDLPNIIVPASGRLTTEIALNGSHDEQVRELFDGDGTAVMIHARPDDYRSDPTGGAGARIACGVLQRT